MSDQPPPPPPSPGGPIAYQSTFGASDGWPVGSIYPSVEASLSDGYKVAASSDRSHPLDSPYQIHSTGISVAATAKDYPRYQVGLGAGCRSPVGEARYIYQFIVWPDGEWFIEEAAPGATPDSVSPVQELQSGVSEPLSDTVSVELQCINTIADPNSTSTLLIGYIGGTSVGSILHDQPGLPNNGWVPLLIETSFGTPISVTYATFTVRTIPTSPTK